MWFIGDLHTDAVMKMMMLTIPMMTILSRALTADLTSPAYYTLGSTAVVLLLVHVLKQPEVSMATLSTKIRLSASENNGTLTL